MNVCRGRSKISTVFRLTVAEREYSVFVVVSAYSTPSTGIGRISLSRVFPVNLHDYRISLRRVLFVSLHDYRFSLRRVLFVSLHDYRISLRRVLFVSLHDCL